MDRVAAIALSAELMTASQVQEANVARSGPDEGCLRSCFAVDLPSHIGLGLVRQPCGLVRRSFA